MIPVRGYEGRKVAVLGLGRSGLTAARALAAGGAEAVVWDDSPAAREKAVAEGLAVTTSRGRACGGTSRRSSSRPASRISTPSRIA
jgi:UDP-N-acetylmuramoylalanine--D-glutamate ligase